MKSNPVKMNPSQTELWNCENAFDFVCPRKWNALGHTEAPEIRYCDVCNQNVYLCETPLEFVSQGKLGRCVAIRKEVTPGEVYPQLYILGEPTAEGAKQMQENYEREEDWWKAVLALNPTFNIEQIDEIRLKFKSRK
jgi:hypothetical protein